MATPTDTHEVLQFNMIQAHQIYKLGYDIILQQLVNPPTNDLGNFLGYCRAWAISIEAHHHSEEEVVFPFLNQRMDFSGEAKQHQAIHDILTKLLALINSAQADHTKFEPAAISQLMVEFKQPLYSHLDEEVERIAAHKLRAANFEEHEILGMNVELETFAKSHGDPFLLVPFMRSHTPPEFKDTWPSMPWVLRKIVIPYVLARRYSGYWKYSPYAMS